MLRRGQNLAKRFQGTSSIFNPKHPLVVSWQQYVQRQPMVEIYSEKDKTLVGDYLKLLDKKLGKSDKDDKKSIDVERDIWTKSFVETGMKHEGEQLVSSIPYHMVKFNLLATPVSVLIPYLLTDDCGCIFFIPILFFGSNLTYYLGNYRTFYLRRQRKMQKAVSLDREMESLKGN